jgi:iron only hydrogenase large subunit-like protein
MAATIHHAVVLDPDACKGCTNCIKRCPVEAIRVRKGKASIIAERCIDCGECIRICPYKAKKADTETLAAIRGWDYAIALPAPALLAQFDSEVPASAVYGALRSLGFSAVVEVAEAAEIVAVATRAALAKRPAGETLISASCPAVVRLIQVRYPSLLDNVVRVLSPMEVAARIAKRRAREAGVKGRIGAFFLTPCPAKATAARLPLGHERSEVDGAISLQDVYLPLVQALSGQARGSAEDASPALRLRQAPAVAGAEGVRWARAEGESEGLHGVNAIAVDGIDRVVELLEQMENGVLSGVDFVEALACPGGCVGGPLTAVNQSIARSRVRLREAERAGSAAPKDRFTELSWTADVFSRPALQLHPDFNTASAMLEELEKIAETLPGLDCGSCGAPSCRALAEDIVRGAAAPTDCIFILRERLRSLTRELMVLEDLEPPSLDHGGSA